MRCHLMRRRGLMAWNLPPSSDAKQPRGATLPGNGYDPTCDFNFDGSVDSTDFGLLIGEFNVMGVN